MASAAQAGSFNDIIVTTTSDVMDGTDSACSLREAIHNVRLATAFGIQVGECASGSNTVTNRIILQSGAIYNLTIPGTGVDKGDLDMLVNAPPVEPNLIITTDDEESAAITQTVANQRVLDNGGAWIEMDNIGIFGGDATSAGSGGGIRNQAGILALNQVEINGNSAGSGGGLSNIGAGVMQINNSSLRLNMATQNLGGGAIFNSAEGEVEIDSGEIRGNQASRGGAIHNLGRLTIKNATVNLNSASDAVTGGGTIYSTGPDSRLVVQDSLFQSNGANNGGSGGAIWSDSTSAASRGGAVEARFVRSNRSRFEGNQALISDQDHGGDGGAIRAEVFRGDFESRFIGNIAAGQGAPSAPMLAPESPTIYSSRETLPAPKAEPLQSAIDFRRQPTPSAFHR